MYSLSSLSIESSLSEKETSSRDLIFIWETFLDSSLFLFKNFSIHPLLAEKVDNGFDFWTSSLAFLRIYLCVTFIPLRNTLLTQLTSLISIWGLADLLPFLISICWISVNLGFFLLTCCFLVFWIDLFLLFLLLFVMVIFSFWLSGHISDRYELISISGVFLPSISNGWSFLRKGYFWS